ncbi:DUF3566 domain-containing protein [Methanobacterium sp.]|uniref:DUF3566 domain-containing protein n=1 Tax=Methanobacterium sp. TaxID=2164 RepID=UPI003C73C1BE
MVDIKEIKSIEIVPYTLMTSSVSAVWAFIYAIFTLILGLVPFVISPTPANSAALWFYIASIVSSPVTSFILGVLQSFLFALIYNLLVPKLGGIKLGLEDLSEIKSVPVVPFALITSTISAVFVLIITLIVMPLVAAYIPVISQVMNSLPLNGTTIPAESISAFGTFGVIGSILSIIILPIVAFIIVFIINAILAVLYNLVAPRVGGIKLEFAANADNMYEILSVAPIQLALISAIIAAICGIIIGIIAIIISAAYGVAIVGVMFLAGFTIGFLVSVFIVYAIMALIYNFLRPKIGGIRLELQ